MNNVKLVGITNPQIRIPVEDAEPGTFMLLSPESFIAYCARVSNPANQNNTETAEKLLKYLVKNKHWSPFEMVHVVMEIETTRDIARQILRHRSFSFQEFSQRYAEVQEMSEPREARLQDTKNRQNSIETDDITLQEKWEDLQREVMLTAQECYNFAIKKGIAKEQARVVLPEGLTMSRMYMSGSLRSWIHYCELRMGNGTQKEHREIATQCWNIITEQFPSLKNVLNNGDKELMDLIRKNSPSIIAQEIVAVQPVPSDTIANLIKETKIENIARMIAAHVGDEKFWGLYKDTAEQILNYVVENTNNNQ